MRCDLEVARLGLGTSRLQVFVRRTVVAFAHGGGRALAGAVLAATAVACTSVAPEVREARATEALCTACHGDDGNSRSARAPILAAQSQAYLTEQLHAFRDHTRADPEARAFMWPMATALTDPAIESLADHFSKLPAVAGQRSAMGDATKGKSLYEQGVVDRGVPACGSCHGEQGVGMAVFPRLAGQHDDYLHGQLAAFASGERANPIMGPIATAMSPEDWADVAAWLASL